MTAEPGPIGDVGAPPPASPPPIERSGRGLPIAVALGATVVLTACYLLTVALVAGAGSIDAAGLTESLRRFLLGGQGWLPPVLFLLLMVPASLLLRRRGVVAWLLASLAIGLIIWVVSFLLPVLLLSSRPDRPAPEVLVLAVTYWPAVVAGVLAREASLWAGLLLSWRHRRGVARIDRAVGRDPGR